MIANSPLRIDLSCVLDHVVSELTAFLRKVRYSYTVQCLLMFYLCGKDLAWLMKY